MAATQKNPAAIEASKEFSNTPSGEHYERMISGMLYDCMDPSLMEGRFRARKLMHKYNNHFPDDATNDSLTADREAMLKQIFGKIGKEPFIEPPLNIDYGSNISIGDRFYSNFNLVILDCAIVRIGDRVMFGPFVSIFAATHETGVQSRRDYIEYAREVSIGDDCWIGVSSLVSPFSLFLSLSMSSPDFSPTRPLLFGSTSAPVAAPQQQQQQFRGAADAGQQQQAYGGQRFQGQAQFGGAAAAGQQQGQWAPHGAGYGQRFLAPAEVQAQFRGTPPFFDAQRGVLFDGKQAWFYQPVAAAVPQAGLRPYGASTNVVTSIETTPAGNIRITLGNGTEGNLLEHRMAPALNYMLDQQNFNFV